MSAVISLSDARARSRARTANRATNRCGVTVDGSVRAVIGPGERGGRILDLYQHEPLRLMWPRAEAGEPLTGILVNTAGGVVGGDRHHIRVDCIANGDALITGQAAEKIYRSSGKAAVVEVDLVARSKARLEWLPQGTILFDGAMLRRHTTIRREPGARILAGEILVLGRLGMGERFRSGFLLDRWRVEDRGKLAWIDALRLDGNLEHLSDSVAGLGGAQALATVIYIGDDAPAVLDDARSLLPKPDTELRAGATVLGSVLICRWLGGEPHRLRDAGGDFWAAFRAHVLDRPERLPVLWQR